MRLRRVSAVAVDPREYLEGANRAFGQWGDDATFAWVFRDDAELLFLDDHAGRAVAGSGITYRILRSGRPAAIMTGSWTLPEARRHGAFTQLLDATCAIAGERDAIVLGFGRTENASRRRFDAAGAGMHPTFYCRSTSVATPATDLDVIEADPEMFPSGFLYSPEQWRMQFLERPHASIQCLGRRGAWAAIVERAAEFDRVHAISDLSALHHLTARALAHHRRLFWYTTREPAMECEWTDGFLSTLPNTVANWEMQNGDRM